MSIAVEGAFESLSAICVVSGLEPHTPCYIVDVVRHLEDHLGARVSCLNVVGQSIPVFNRLNQVVALFVDSEGVIS